MTGLRWIGRGKTEVRWLAAVLLTATLALVCGGCGGMASRGEPKSLTGTDLEQAQRLYAQLKREHSLERDRKALDLAASLLDYYPTFERNDEVMVLAVDAAARLDDRRQALGLTDELLVRYPDSPLIDQALLRGAELAEAGRDTLTAAGYLITYHDRDPARSTRTDGKPRVARLVDEMARPQITLLMERFPASAVWTYLGYANTQACLDAGDYGAAGDVAARLEKRYPQDHWTLSALELVGAGSGPGRKMLLPAGEVHPDELGVLVPLTGRYAVLGNAFYEAALLATNESNQEFGTDFSLKLLDTGADPVVSALAARQLCAEMGSIAVLGGLLSAPTASAAVVCDAYGVPLVSPTATNDNIWQLGPGIFQTNITGLYEVRLLAQLATEILLKQRFAILHPDTPEGLRHAQVFANEIESRGGEIVATAVFPEQGTDFKDPILAVRKERPEVIFAPATVDQMVLLGPQLDFYRAGALVLGLSNWNSNKLRDRSGTVLERALFPDDLVLFPARWEAEFNRVWSTDTYPPEATALALKAYQATRMLQDTLAQSQATTRQQLREALTRRLANQDLAVEGPESFGATMRMFRDERIVPFPSPIFADGWNLTEGAQTDSLGTDAPEGEVPAGDAVPGTAPVDEPSDRG